LEQIREHEDYYFIMARDNTLPIMLALGGSAALWWLYRSQSGAVDTSDDYTYTDPGSDEISPPVSAPSPAPVNPSQPRGIRLNNPGNIEQGGSPWLGLSPDQSADPRYASFTDPIYGIRAMAYIMFRSYAARGLKTPLQIISTWAPSKDNNNVPAYVADVTARSGVSPNAPVPPALIPAFIAGVIQHENGQQPYPLSLIAQAVSMA
jgi:hypothetical protein